MSTLVEIKKALNPSQMARKAKVLKRRGRSPSAQRELMAEQSRRSAMGRLDAGDRVPRAARKRGYDATDYSIAIDGPPKGSRKRLP